MLTMRWLSMGGRLNQKSKYYLAASVVIILVILGVWLAHGKHKAKSPAASGNSGPSTAAIASFDTNSAQKAVAAKDYKTAINNYIEAVNAAEADGDLNKAESLLKDAINKIPDSSVPWEIWDDLVGVAKAKGDKTLEISSLKKAIIKAQQSNSGAPQGIVNIYNKMLKQLGAA